MNEYTLYSTELTDNETSLGFKLVDVTNPRGHFAYNPDTVSAVVFQLGPRDRIIKINNPMTGKQEYKHQTHGRYDFQDDSQAEWLPVSSFAYPTPESAIEYTTKRQSPIMEELKKFDPVIVPVDPNN